MNTKHFFQQYKDCSLYNANEELLQNSIVQASEKLQHICGDYLSPSCVYLDFPSLLILLFIYYFILFYFLRYIGEYEIYPLRVWVKRGTVQILPLTQILKKQPRSKTKKTNKQRFNNNNRKERRFETSFEYQMFHCLVHINYSFNQLCFLEA